MRLMLFASIKTPTYIFYISTNLNTFVFMYLFNFNLSKQLTKSQRKREELGRMFILPAFNIIYN